MPGTNEPAKLDDRMRASLADSLTYVYSVAKSRLDLQGSDVAVAIAAIRAHRVPPSVFGRYYKLVLALQKQRYDVARDLLLAVVRSARSSASFEVALYRDDALGADKALYGDLIDPTPGATPWLCSPEALDGFDQRVRDALAMLEVADPDLAAELRGLMIQVVGAVPFDGLGARPFGSVSSFMLWGLVIVNMERYVTAADLIQGLVHEAAHQLLFAHSVDEPLVTNPIEERYLSPLRSDPRPMDGVFHATFVSARMYYANVKLRAATTPSFMPVPIEELEDRIALIRGLYAGGLKTIQDHGKLTATGQLILSETMDYMKAA